MFLKKNSLFIKCLKLKFQKVRRGWRVAYSPAPQGWCSYKKAPQQPGRNVNSYCRSSLLLTATIGELVLPNTVIFDLNLKYQQAYILPSDSYEICIKHTTFDSVILYSTRLKQLLLLHFRALAKEIFFKCNTVQTF